LLVDIKPIIQWFFLLHGNAVKRLTENHIDSTKPEDDAEEFRQKIDEVRQTILEALGGPFESSALLQAKLGNLKTLAKWSGDTDREKEIEEFVKQCGKPIPKLGDGTQQVQSLIYLQPYVTIALANLLVAHGSPDEAVDVLAQWLDLWRCARRQGTPDQIHATPCRFGPVQKAAGLPEWFGIRAEFELSVLLYRMAGEQNITYRDFLKEHAVHFGGYVERPERYLTGSADAKQAKAASDRSVTIRGALRQCSGEDRSPNSDPSSKGDPTESDYRAITLRSLLQNEETLLRSEIYFLPGTTAANWADLEGFHARAKMLAGFRLQCIYPEGTPDQKHWEAQLASYKITYGLVSLAVAQRLMINAGGADERYRAQEIQKEGARQLRDGYRDLKPHRDDDRKKFDVSFWSERIFSVSAWEQTCTLAERALDQLNRAGQ
jgi:hypothetical protein